MTFAQIYAVFIHPFLMLAIVLVFAAFLMRQHRRNAQRIREMEAKTHAADAIASTKHIAAE